MFSSRLAFALRHMSTKAQKVGLVGMGHVGDAVLHNLRRQGFQVTAIQDISAKQCQGYPEEIRVVSSAKEVAQVSDVVVTGEAHKQFILTITYLYRVSYEFLCSN